MQCQKRGIGKAWICIDGSNNDCDSDGNFLAEKRKSKSHDVGNIVSYMWAVSANNGTPITYSVYRGGQVDSKALHEMIVSLTANGIRVSGVILDRGFCNVDSLKLLSGEGILYVVMLKGNINSHKDLVRYGKELRLNNIRYLIKRSGMYGVSEKSQVFSSDSMEAYVSLYYDSKNGVQRVNCLTDRVKAEVNDALAAVVDERKVSISTDCKKYIKMTRKGRGTKIEIDKEELQKAVDSKGFSCIASSDEMTADEKDANLPAKAGF